MTEVEHMADEAALVQRLQRHERAALKELLRAYGGNLYAVASRFVGAESAVEEVLQRTLMRVWQKIGTFDEHADFPAWLRRITTDAAVALAGERGLPEHDRVANRGDERVQTQDLAAGEPDELGQTVRRAVDQLPASCRRVVMLRDIEGYSVKAIGELTDSGPLLVEARLHHGRLLLRKSLLPYLTGQAAGSRSAPSAASDRSPLPVLKTMRARGNRELSNVTGRTQPN